VLVIDGLMCPQVEHIHLVMRLMILVMAVWILPQASSPAMRPELVGVPRGLPHYPRYEERAQKASA
jgi:hypothetical protein